MNNIYNDLSLDGWQFDDFSKMEQTFLKHVIIQYNQLGQVDIVIELPLLNSVIITITITITTFTTTPIMIIVMIEMIIIIIMMILTIII